MSYVVLVVPMISPTGTCRTSGENVLPAFPTETVCVIGPPVVDEAFVDDCADADATAADDTEDD